MAAEISVLGPALPDPQYLRSAQGQLPLRSFRLICAPAPASAPAPAPAPANV